MSSSAVRHNYACLWLFALLGLGWSQQIWPGDRSSRRNFCSAPSQPTNGEWKLHPDRCSVYANCNVLEGTKLEPGSKLLYSCNHGYRITNANPVFCRPNGRWSVIPTCTACGMTATVYQSLVVGKKKIRVSESTWHASLHQSTNRRSGYQRKFLCGATIINNNFVLTAAHCVYEKKSNTTMDLNKLFVIAGNIFRQYASSKHDPRVVQKSAVKKMTVFDASSRLSGHYYSDIALLELRKPFEPSPFLMPVCLDYSGNSESIPRPGGVASFGINARGKPKQILQTLNVPFIPDRQCDAHNFDRDNAHKICRNHTDGISSALYKSDSGSGLVSKIGNRWYLVGVVSDALNTADKSKFVTKVSHSTSWIEKISTNVERKEKSNSPTTTETSRGEIARQKCSEYQKFVYTLRTNPVIGREPLKVSECAIHFQNLMYVRDDVAEAVEPKKFPHMAAVGFDSGSNGIKWKCSGSIISERFVLTAAHCANHDEWGEASWVLVGDTNLKGTTRGASPQELRITERMIHPEYKPPASYHDIALLRLETDIKFNGWTRPACLHTSATTDTRKATATGWGIADLGDEEDSSYLRRTIMHQIDRQSCNTRWQGGRGERKLPNGIIEHLSICAGGPCVDTFQADTGGPLVIYSKKEYYCMYDIVGVNSIARSCAMDHPGVYTRVYHYVPWIESIVWGRD